MGRQTSVEIRQLIIHLYKKGKSQRKIAEYVNKSRGTVQHIIHRFTRGGTVANKQKKSKKKRFADRDEAFIVREIKKNPHLSAPKLTKAVEEQLNIHVNPETVLFTDESKFNLFGSDGKRMVWRQKNSEFQQKNLTPSMKHGGGSVMVWGCMAGGGTGNLQHIPGIMDKYVYIGILKQNLKPSVEKLGIEGDFYFYQDNDPKHKSFVAREYLLYNCPHVLEVPPQSPDINIIENLWFRLDQNLRKHSISSKQNLLDALQDQ